MKTERVKEGDGFVEITATEDFTGSFTSFQVVKAEGKADWFLLAAKLEDGGTLTAELPKRDMQSFINEVLF